jgi:hypothetical protein
MINPLIFISFFHPELEHSQVLLHDNTEADIQYFHYLTPWHDLFRFFYYSIHPELFQTPLADAMNFLRHAPWCSPVRLLSKERALRELGNAFKQQMQLISPRLGTTDVINRKKL